MYPIEVIRLYSGELQIYDVFDSLIRTRHQKTGIAPTQALLDLFKRGRISLDQGCVLIGPPLRVQTTNALRLRAAHHQLPRQQ